MGSYETLTNIRTAILAEALTAVSDVGQQIVTLEPIEGGDRVAWLEQYIASLSTGVDELRGMHVFPGPGFHTPRVDATGTSGYTWIDTWRWDVMMYRAAEASATERDAALNRACDAMDRIRRSYENITDVELWAPPAVRFLSHGYGEISGKGVWLSQFSTEWQVGVSEELL